MKSLDNLLEQVLPKIASDPAVLSALKEGLVKHLDEHGLKDIPRLNAILDELLIRFVQDAALGDDDVKEALKQALDLGELTSQLVKPGEGAWEAFKAKVSEVLKSRIEDWDMGDDEDITDDMDSELSVNRELIRQVIKDSPEIQEAFAQKMKDEILSYIENTDWSDDSDVDDAIEKSLDYSVAIRKLCTADPDTRKSLEDFLRTAIDSWIENLSPDDPKTVEALVDSPVIIELVDQVLAEKMNSNPLLRQKIEQLVESALSNPIRLQPLVDKRVAEIIAVMATQQPKSGS